jgi:hypothetical protein
VRSLPILILTTPDGLSHYRCVVCSWTWGSDLPADRTTCPVRGRHRGLLKLRRLRAKQRGGEPVTVGDLLTAAEDSGL